MKNMLPRILVVVLILLVSGLIYSYLSMNKTYTVTEVDKVSNPESYKTYDGGYNGPLYAVSEKTGSGADFDQLFDNMDTNGVKSGALYFGYEGGGMVMDLLDNELGNIIKVNMKHPGRIISFYSTGIGGKEEGNMAGKELLAIYKEGYDRFEKSAPGLIKGIGEVELYAWDMPHNDQRVLDLMEFASERDLYVMLHPSRGKLKQIEDVYKKYPDIIFIMHMFYPDFLADRSEVIRLLREYPNVYYTIDVDHLLFDSQSMIGLLYKYQESDSEDAVKNFLADYERLADNLLKHGMAAYGPMITEVPSKIMWGTEMSADYTYNPKVYDKMIEFTRRFLGVYDGFIQEMIGYKNAELVLGFGVQLEN